MPDQALLDGSLKQGPALSATSDLPRLNPDPAAIPQAAPAPGSPTGAAAAESAPPAEAGAGVSADGTGAPSADQQPELPLEEAPPQPKPRQSFGERISDLARQRNEAFAQRDRAIEAAVKLTERLEAILPALEGRNQQQPAPPPEPDLTRPRRSEYADPDAYDDAIADWAEQRAVRRAEARAQEIANQAEERRRAAEEQARQQAEQQRAQAQQNEIYTRWQSSVSAYTKDHPEFDLTELSNRPMEEFPVTQQVLGALLASDNGPAVLDHLGAHPDELKRIAALPDARVPIEIGKLEARLTAPPPPPPAPRAPAPPANRVGASAAAAQETMVDIGSQPGRTEEYAKLRMPQLQAERHASMFGVRQP